MFIGTVGTSIMEAMAAFERALKHALHSHVALDEEDAAEPVMHAIQALRNAAAGTLSNPEFFPTVHPSIHA